MKFECPPNFREGIARYQMTCNDCPYDIRRLCHEATKYKQIKEGKRWHGEDTAQAEAEKSDRTSHHVAESDFEMRKPDVSQ